ncbi:N-acetylneuraminate synthase family protein [Pelagibacterales bacterium SAG-MED38]|nr:N-acetylneuraminate synthase family protein [Pelagibacterales bacterium SAG-MED38]MBD1141557.1 N-acetylneuraminate synthase family protein [Pelagibacterales bacterium SAG-MED32]
MSIFIVAEIGINHNGDLKLCKELIDVAEDAGCDAVKFQKRNIDEVYTQEFLNSPRESQWGNTQRDQKKGLEFGKEEYDQIDKYCKEKKIEWFASAWDKSSQFFLREYNCNYNKVASAMIVYEDLLKMIAEEKKHTFISTGMSEISDIERAVKIFKDNGCPFELMHTVSTYPMKDENANLNLIKTLRDKFNCDVGYSGHEPGIVISLAAASMGITSLERHITLGRHLYGSDQSASVEPNGLRNLVASVRKIESAMGDGIKSIIPDEIPIAEKLREHINNSSN